ncbi:cobalt ABC transporter permease [Paenibacillus albidus]|uniref:Cobalt ABC transporter permease n=1 Tax=Paenibacillus albidus TaxID=2041023 RepID=A0A917FG16_9BACL|nr:energy-coupling factor transporter transmembrane component T [Paenibacillus albidus]GGF78377.1 cobalt ABC transporter permease [Paenibacillus albidus]
MRATMLAYTNHDSGIHRLTGAAKLIFFAVWSVSAMITYDTRCLLVLFLFSLFAFKISKVQFQDYAFVLYLILIFFVLNHIAIFLFSPLEGVRIYGTRHDVVHIAGRYTLTWEQLFYQFNIALKYAVVIPMALLFLMTTDPSEFSASLNRVGFNYKIAYSVSLALRYIPDIQRDYENISFSAQARGIDISRKEKLPRRLKNIILILMPLILTSIERIDKISTAMELRGFGQKEKRTWYRARPFARNDYIAIGIIAGIAVLTAWITFYDGSRYYNIFK